MRRFGSLINSRIQSAPRSWAGAEIFTTVSTDAKAQTVKDAGADHVIMYTHQDFEAEVKKATGGEGVRMIFDAVGKTTFTKGMNCLGLRGYMALYGAASGPIEPIEPSLLQGGSRILTRPSLGDYTSPGRAVATDRHPHAIASTSTNGNPS